MASQTRKFVRSSLSYYYGAKARTEKTREEQRQERLAARQRGAGLVRIPNIPPKLTTDRRKEIIRSPMEELILETCKIW
jgi:hypothetical protein